jgi:NADPH:quinone reductase-like Zn-dependent oxidoreductase
MTFLRIVISLYLFVLSMIFSENRYPLFRIMLWMLFGKTILVTGVSSGIGARTAELASHLGAVCTEDPIRVYRMTESAKLARWSASFWPY